MIGQNTIEKNEKTISELSIRLHRANNDVESLQQSFNPLEKRNFTLNEQLEKEKILCDELRILVEEQRASNGISIAEQTIFQQTISELAHNNQALESSISHLKQEALNLNSQIESLNTRNNANIFQNKEKISELNILIVDLEYDVKSRDQTINMKNSESILLNDKLTLIMENFKREKESFMSDTNEKLNFLKSNTSQSIKHLEDSLKFSSEKIELLIGLKTENEQEIAKLSGLLEQKVKMIDSLSQEKHNIIEADKFDHQRLSAQISNLSEKLKLSEIEVENLKSILATKDSKLADLHKELNLKICSYNEAVEKLDMLIKLKKVLEKKIADKEILEMNINNLSKEVQNKTSSLEKAEMELCRMREATKIDLVAQKEKINAQINEIKALEKKIHDDMVSYKESAAKILKEKTDSEIRAQKEIQIHSSQLDKVMRDLEEASSDLQKKVYECDELKAQKNASVNGNQYLTQLLKQTQSENLQLKWNFELTEQMLSVEKDTNNITKKDVEKLTVELKDTKGNYFQMEKEFEFVKMKLSAISEIRDQLQEERKKLISDRDAKISEENILDIKMSKVQQEVNRLATFDQMILSQFKQQSEKTRKEEQKKQKLLKKKEKDMQQKLLQLEQLQAQRKKVEKERALNDKLLKLNNQKKLANLQFNLDK
jgi:chromosome segregation ATPase